MPLLPTVALVLSMSEACVPLNALTPPLRQAAEAPCTPQIALVAATQPDNQEQLINIEQLRGSLDTTPACSRPRNHDQADLCAQWVAAQAAMRSARWALVQTLLGALGFFAVIWTIKDEQRRERTAKAASEKDFEARHRPWLNITVASVSGIHIMGMNRVIDVEITVENLGTSPAHHVDISHVWIAESGYKHPSTQFPLSAQSMNARVGFGMTVFPGKTRKETRSCLLDQNLFSSSPEANKHIQLNLAVAVSYSLLPNEESKYQSGEMMQLVGKVGSSIIPVLSNDPGSLMRATLQLPLVPQSWAI